MILKKFDLTSELVMAMIFVVMIVMSISLLPISTILAVMHFAIVLAIGALWIVDVKNKQSRFKSISDSIKKFFGGNSGDILEAVPMPVIIVSSKNANEILFYNDNFKTEFLDKGYCSSNGIGDILENETVETLLEKKQELIKIGDESYRIYIKKFFDFVIIYFKDDTLYRDLKREVIGSRLCVGYVSFDNREELKQSSSDETILRVSLGVEEMLQKWAISANGIFEKIAEDKYVILFQEKYLKKFVAEKFKILEKIHSLNTAENKNATISIGISCGEDTFEGKKEHAKSALNMALGRGGDQVAIIRNNKYEFFGGNSGGIEKRSKVRTRVVAQSLLEKIEAADKVFIMGHKFSDFDSIGAATALWGVCKRLKKMPCAVVINKTHTLALELVKYLEGFEKSMFISPERALGEVTDRTLLIVVDTHSANFVEDGKLYEKCRNVVVIDHHRMHVNKITNADIFFHEPFASSACEMVTEMVQYMDDKCLKKYEADALLAGITLDTKNFSIKTGIRTFEAAAYLKRRGADSLLVKRLFSNSLESYKLRCKVIEDCSITQNCAVACLKTDSTEPKMACAQAADELLNVKNVKASFVLFKNNGVVNISARSMGDVNVQVIMEKFGGGGHQTMAAAQLPEDYDIERAKKELIEILNENNKNGD